MSLLNDSTPHPPQVSDVVKIQAFMRAKKAKKEYTQLVQVTQPAASTVRKFLALLEQSDIDFSEEIGEAMVSPESTCILFKPPFACFESRLNK